MRLFRFLDQRGGLATLEMKMLKVSRIAELNDPFELRIGHTGIPPDKLERVNEARANSAKRINDANGLISFSQNAREPVLWSHYADHHRGMVLEIAVTENPDLLIEMEYSDERPHVKHTPGFVDSDTLNALKKVVRTKSRGWAYEKEFRLYEDLDKCSISNGLYLTPLPQAALHRVILGWQCPIEISYIRRLLLQSGFQNCDVVNAEFDETSFLISYAGMSDQHPVDLVNFGD